MDASQPRSVRELDKDFRTAVRTYHRIRWYIVIVLFVILAAGLVAFGILFFRDEARIQASCQFWDDLGGAPLTVSPTTHQPTALSVKIITDSRAAWRRQGCAGRQVPPDPSLAHWMRVFGIRADAAELPSLLRQ